MDSSSNSEYMVLVEIVSVLILLLVMYIAYMLKNQRGGEPSDLTTRVVESLTKIETKMNEKEKLDEVRIKHDQAFKEKMEKGLTSMYRIMAGTKTRGTAGEEMLKNILSEPIKLGLVVRNLRVDGLTVEFGFNLGDGKYIPIDSKIPDIDELLNRLEKTEDVQERKKIKNKIVAKIKTQITEAQKYKNRTNTVDKVILAVPDGFMEFLHDISTENVRKSGVIVTGYSYVFFYCYVLYEAYQKSLERGDIGEYVQTVQELLSILRDIEANSGKIDKGVKMIENANKNIKSKTLDSKRHEHATKKKRKIKLAVEA